MQIQKSLTIRTVSFFVMTLVMTAFGLKSTSAGATGNEAASRRLIPPTDGTKIQVAFVLTEGATVIDFAGPWDVFESVGGEEGPNPFELFTVGESRNPIHVSSGMTITPDYTFSDAPPAKIVVVPAQKGSPAMGDWLRRISKQSDVVMSVCTGAFQLGRAGLLDGKRATTHHEFYDQFQNAFPKAILVKDARWVQSDDVIYTAGGETSGIDLALHIVEKYYGRDVAQKTADFMEYQGKGWIDNSASWR